MRLRRIVGFLAASFVSSLLFFAIFTFGSLVFRTHFGIVVRGDPLLFVLTWAVHGWPVVAIGALFPAMAFIPYAESSGSGPAFYSLAGAATAAVPTLVWIVGELGPRGDMGEAGLAGIGLVMAGAVGGLVYWLIAGRARALRAMAMTD